MCHIFSGNVCCCQLHVSMSLFLTAAPGQLNVPGDDAVRSLLPLCCTLFYCAGVQGKPGNDALLESDRCLCPLVKEGISPLKHKEAGNHHFRARNADAAVDF